MGMFTGIVRRSNSNDIKKEDDLTSEIKTFFEKQKQENYTMKNEGKDFSVTVDGDVHIYEDDINKEGTLDFKLDEVTGNLICHVKSISPDVVPDKLGGCIIFDVESIMTNPSAGAVQATEDDDFDGMELLSPKAPTESDTRKKIESLISDCVEYGFNIDIESILEKMKEEKLNSDKYKLRIEYELFNYNKYQEDVNHKRYQSDGVKRCDIYVSDSDEDILNLTAINKAAYLASLLYKDGFVLDDMPTSYLRSMKAIYQKLPDKVENTINGITDDNLKMKTFNGYRNEIRNAIKDRISNNYLVNDFAIEGYKEKPFKIAKSTPEIRELIREIFDLH